MSNQVNKSDEVKPGNETSSYRLVLLTILFTLLAPLPPVIAAVVVRHGWLPGEFGGVVEQTLSQVLAAVGGLLGITGGVVLSKALPAYIKERGEISKIKALAASGLPVTSAAVPAPPAAAGETPLTPPAARE